MDKRFYIFSALGGLISFVIITALFFLSGFLSFVPLVNICCGCPICFIKMILPGIVGAVTVLIATGHLDYLKGAVSGTISGVLSVIILNLLFVTLLIVVLVTGTGAIALQEHNINLEQYAFGVTIYIVIATLFILGSILITAAFSAFSGFLFAVIYQAAHKPR
jgi:hypothetical protein